MRAHIASHLTVICQATKTGRDGRVFPKIQNAGGRLFSPTVLAESGIPFHIHVDFYGRARSASTISPDRCSYGTEISRSISSLSGRPNTEDHTARPARKPDAPACIATLTARGNSFSSTPDERITHGMLICSFSFCEAFSRVC